MKKLYKNGDKKSKESKETEKRKYKKGKDSDSEGDNNQNSSGSENDNDNDNIGSIVTSDKTDQQKFDIQEYRKMLAEMFPSKYMDNRVSMLEKDKKNSKSSQVSASAYDHSTSNSAELAKIDTKKSTGSSNKKTNGGTVVDENRKVT